MRDKQSPRAELEAALRLIAQIDRLPAEQSAKRMAEDDAQRALEVIARAKAAAR